MTESKRAMMRNFSQRARSERCTFHGEHVPAQMREAVQRVVALAIDATRPAGEHWTVRASEPLDGATITFDFSSDHEAPRSITVALEGDDAECSVLYRTACRLLRREMARRGQSALIGILLDLPNHACSDGSCSRRSAKRKRARCVANALKEAELNALHRE